MRSAAIFFRADNVVVHAQHQTTDEFWIAGAPAFRIDRAELATALVKAVKQALDASLNGVENPSNWRSLLAPVLAVARARSWSALARNSHMCQIEGDSDGVTVVPTRNGGVTGDDRGFHELRNLSISVSDPDDDDRLLEALLQAEELCESS
jgi:hypothetical protein